MHISCKKYLPIILLSLSFSSFAYAEVERQGWSSFADQIGLTGDKTGTFDLTTTGLGTLGSLVVDTNTLVANVSGYENRVGIGTATPAYPLDVYGNVYLRNTTYTNIINAETYTKAGYYAAYDGTNVIFRLLNDSYDFQFKNTAAAVVATISSAGLGTLGSLAVDTSTLVANVAGYTDKVGIGTATPADTLEVSYPSIGSTFAGNGALFRNPTASDAGTTKQISPALILSGQGRGAINQQGQWATVLIPDATNSNLNYQFWYKQGAGAWTQYPFLMDISNGFYLNKLSLGEVANVPPAIFWMVNASNATVGSDQYTPTMTWLSKGWKTAATAATQYMYLSHLNAPEQGTLSPIGVHKWLYGINTAATENEELMRLQWGSDAGVTGVVLNQLSLNDYVFRVEGATDANLLVTDAATESVKICGATTSLLGFYGATAVNQPDTVADAATQDLTGTDTLDRTKTEADLTSCKNAINAVIDRLQELGLIA